LALEAKARGNAHFKAKEWEAAIKEYTAAIEFDPNVHSFYSNRSACLAEQRKYKEALQDAEKVTQIKPDWPKGYSRKGFALFNLGRVQEAWDAYEEGLKKDPTNESLKSGKMECERFMKQQQHKQTLMQLSLNPETRELIKKPQIQQKLQLILGNPQMLLQCFKDPNFLDDDMKKVLKVAFPDLAPLFEKVEGGDNSFSTEAKEPEPHKEKTPEPEEPEKELTEEEKQQQALDQKAEALKQEGNAFYKKRSFDEAFTKYKEAFDLRPDNQIFCLNMSAVLFMQEKYDECEGLCQQAISICRKYKRDYKFVAKALNRLATIQLKKGDVAKAIALYKESLMEYSDGKIKDKIKKLERELKEEEARKYINPEKAEEERMKGNECFKASKFPEAVKHYTEGIRRDPSNPKLYNNRATAYSKLMAFREAKKDAMKCIELDPTFVKAWIRKGRIEHLNKEYHTALQSYEKAMDIDPKNPELMKFVVETRMAIQERNSQTNVDSKEQARILNDPEIQAILQDREIDFILKRAQVDPSILQGAMKDPVKAKKLKILFDAGVIRTG